MATKKKPTTKSGKQSKVHKVMDEYKHGTLKSGKGGAGGKVKSRKQAIAIALSESGQTKKTKKTASRKKTAKRKAVTKNSLQQKNPPRANSRITEQGVDMPLFAMPFWANPFWPANLMAVNLRNGPFWGL
jgi:2,4-dienoyl-CoA reductase-like NADH-dependent reductase (Old Yellow Enzyme family)